jgi:hypothetical protein
MAGLACSCGENVPSSQRRLVKLVVVGKITSTTRAALLYRTDLFVLYWSENPNAMNKDQSAAAVDDSALNASTVSLSLLSK